MEIKTVISNAISEGRVEWKTHALKRLLERELSREDVLLTLQNGEVIEEYPNDFPFSSCLIFNNDYLNPIHVVVALDIESMRVFIITVYRPDEFNFEQDFKTRKKL